MKKTKYMKIGNEIDENMNHLRTQSYKFEKVTTFNYLGVSLGQTYKHRIKERIQKGYQALGRNKMLLKSKSISKANKLKIYKTLIRPVITYALETAVLNKREEEDLKIIERKILRIILGPDTTKGVRRAKKNKEIEEELENENIVRLIKATRLKWAGHIMRRRSAEMVRRITQWVPLWPRKRGRPRKTWREEIEKDARALGIEDWKEKCRDRKNGKK